LHPVLIMYTCVHIREGPMATLKVGIREFREKLASYLLESDTPVAITRHGDTVGYYIPARRKRTEADRAALKEAASRLQQMLDAQGISEDEVAADFKLWRSGRKRIRARGSSSMPISSFALFLAPGLGISWKLTKNQ